MTPQQTKQLKKKSLAKFKRDCIMTPQWIEQLEKKYLNKFYHFLKYVEDEMLEGLQTKDNIRNDWIQYWSTEGHSDFDVGAERIIYALFNGKGIGQPNSSPVGADLFFETKNAYIHIDIKTVVAMGNVDDYNTSAVVGRNQNSYKGTILVQGNKPPRAYNPSLPSIYNSGKDNEKICLSYFITILYEKEDIKILNINLLSMPNGSLEPHYKNRPLKAGKSPGKKPKKNLPEARFNFKEVHKFELLSNTATEILDTDNSRIKVIYMDVESCEEYDNKMKFLLEVYSKQNLESSSL